MVNGMTAGQNNSCMPFECSFGPAKFLCRNTLYLNKFVKVNFDFIFIAQITKGGFLKVGGSGLRNQNVLYLQYSTFLFPNTFFS
jgi:hypothetical protein